MVLPTVMFYFGGVYLSLDILRACGFRAPFRISSTPKGSIMPTALYVLIEDVVAVDGGGGQIYRYALRTRYLSSPYFRRMLFVMNCFWAGGSIVCAAAITAIVFTVSEPVAYTVSFALFTPRRFGWEINPQQLGWSLPFAWAGVWTLITIPWVQSDLRREKKAWQEGSLYGGIQYTDDPNAPTPRTRFESVQAHLPHYLPWNREKSSPSSTPPDCPAEGGVASGARTGPGSPPSVHEKRPPRTTPSNNSVEDQTASGDAPSVREKPSPPPSPPTGPAEGTASEEGAERHSPPTE